MAEKPNDVPVTRRRLVIELDIHVPDSEHRPPYDGRDTFDASVRESLRRILTKDGNR